MFEGFERVRVEAQGASINAVVGGEGPPLLLLHGNPQTHAMWHLIAPRLAEDFTVVATDLRGYGDSSKPETTPDHAPYSKRTMAEDQVAVMRALGFERFSVCGHDRGGRVGYRMALDQPEAMEEYVRCLRDPKTIHATCEDYRAAPPSTTSTTPKTARRAGA